MVEDTPDDLVFELHNETLWGTHPYGYSILGTRETVESLGVPRPARAASRGPTILASSWWPQRQSSSTNACSTCSRETGWTDAAPGDATPLVPPPPHTAPP